MTPSLSPERWAQIQRLFDDLVDLAPEDRADRLCEAGRDDPDLCQEVESLLAAYAQADDRLEGLDHIVDEMPKLRPDASASRADTRVGPYQIVEQLGAGGMGVVYKARDTRLDRFVALKFLPPQLSAHEAARTRFVHEAKAASALDHPNICTIYEIGEDDQGRGFIAMAYYEGQTLKQKIQQGRLPVEEALDYAAQMAQGLARAHEAGIIHRDIKPANVVITKRGRVKIVDFGLAKVADVQLTRTGATMGTVAYMSPEQARGEQVDHRTDLWSLGVVLYEMLTGARPFQGDYEQAIVYAALHEEPPPITRLNPALPEELESVVAMCLEKDPALRYPEMADLLADLEVFVEGDGAGPSATLRAMRPRQRTVHTKTRLLAGLGLGVVALLVLLVALPSVRQAALPGGEAVPAQRRMAVLPFTTIGDDPVNLAFSEGLLHTVTSKLTAMEQFQQALLVIPAMDVLAEDVKSTRQADALFGVNMVITGSVERSGDLVRLTLNLVDVASGGQVNSRTLDAPSTNLLAFQDEVVRKLAELLDVELNPASEQILLAGGTTEPGAYEFYLEGQGYLQRFTDEAKVDVAISLFENAIEVDDRYALAYAGLGEAHWRKYERTRDAQWVDKAIENAQRALDLNDRLAPVHVTLGLIYRETGRHEDAEREYLLALEKEPNNPEAYRGLGAIYANQNKLGLAEQSYKKAIELRPGYWSFYNDLGIFYHNAGRHEDAAEQFRRVTELSPDNPWGYNNVGVQYTTLGRPDEAIPWYEKATRVNPGEADGTATGYFNLGGIYYKQENYAGAVEMYEASLAIKKDIDAWADLGNAYHWLGKPDQARDAWQQMIGLARERLAVNPASAYALRILAFGYARLGEREQALAAVNRLLALQRKSAGTLRAIARTYERLGERDSALHYVEEALANGSTLAPLEASKWLDDLRADPRYQKLIEPYVPQDQTDERP